MAGHAGPVTGLVLAGGEGRRMGGVDKGLLLLGGQPLVARVAARLRPQVDKLLLSANRARVAGLLRSHAGDPRLLLWREEPAFEGVGHPWRGCRRVPRWTMNQVRFQTSKLLRLFRDVFVTAVLDLHKQPPFLCYSNACTTTMLDCAAFSHRRAAFFGA
jgi:hypothetical protein